MAKRLNQLSSADLELRLNETPFPNEDVDPKVKESVGFGKKIANYIVTRHYYDYALTNRKDKIHENRMYGDNRQNVDQYKPRPDEQITNLGDNSLINIDYSITSVAKKFVDIAVNDILNQDFKIELNTIDPSSQTRKQNARDKYFGVLIRKMLEQDLSEASGIDFKGTTDFNPQDEEDIEMHMTTSFKDAVEIGMEEIIELELFWNEWDYIKKRVVRDIVENNKGAVRLYFDEDGHLRVRYVDIIDLVTSYTDQWDYHNVDYEGEIKRLTIREIRRLSQKQPVDTRLTEEKLFYIAKNATAIYGNPKNWAYGDTYSRDGYHNNLEYAYDSYTVDVLDFSFYTTDVKTYSKKKNPLGGYYFDEKDYGYTSKRTDREITNKEFEARYDGMYVIDTGDIVFYERGKNLMRKTEGGKMKPDILRTFVIYENNLRYGVSTSMVEQMRPIIDDMQNLELSMRNIIAEAAPPGVDIDIDAINDIKLGTRDMNPIDIIKIRKQKGIGLYDGKDEHGNPRNRPPIQETVNGVKDALIPLVQQYAFKMGQLRDITGINESVDATKPDERSLVGVQKLAILSSSNARRHQLESYLNIYKRTGELMGKMAQITIVHGDGEERYKEAISKLDVKAVEFMDNIKVAEIGIKTETVPTGEDLEILNRRVETALANQEISLEDSMEIYSYTNMKKAQKVLAYRKRKKLDRDMQIREQEAQIEAQKVQAEIMASAEAERIKYDAKADSEIKVLAYKYDREEQLQVVRDQGKSGHIEREGDNKKDEIMLASELDLEETEGSKQVPQPKVFPKPIEAAVKT